MFIFRKRIIKVNLYRGNDTVEFYFMEKKKTDSCAAVLGEYSNFDVF